MTGRLVDLGARCAGQVLDEAAWADDSRVRAAVPARHVVGTVHTIYPLVPEVVGVVLDSGVRVTVQVGGVPDCQDCGHGGHEVGDCMVAVAVGDRLGRCPCGEDVLLLQRELADRAWEAHVDAGRVAAAEAEL